MKVKEIRVLVTYPYQLAPYLYGKVEMAEVVGVDDSEVVDTEQAEADIVKRLIGSCKQASLLAFLEGQGEPISKGLSEGCVSEPEPDDAPPSVRRRRNL
jgi:hypothetical protein